MKRWLSILLLGGLAFFQASLAIAACAIDRGQLAQMLSAPSHDCCDETADAGCTGAMAPPASVCLSHSTADLQALGVAVSGEHAPAQVVVRFLPRRELDSPLAFRAPSPLPNAVPARILLHSFLV